MSYNTAPSLGGLIRAVQARLSVLEKQTHRARRFATDDRPTAASVTGEIILNTTTGKFEGSDGTNWQALH